MGMKEYALAYQKKGFSVLPISPTGKKPMIAFADKPPMTAQEIEDFWTQYPDSNIAVRTDKFSSLILTYMGKLMDLRVWPIGNTWILSLQLYRPKRPAVANISFISNIQMCL